MERSIDITQQTPRVSKKTIINELHCLSENCLQAFIAFRGAIQLHCAGHHARFPRHPSAQAMTEKVNEAMDLNIGLRGGVHGRSNERRFITL